MTANDLIWPGGFQFFWSSWLADFKIICSTKLHIKACFIAKKSFLTEVTFKSKYIRQIWMYVLICSLHIQYVCIPSMFTFYKMLHMLVWWLDDYLRSNKFWSTDLALYLCFSPIQGSPVNVLASSLSCSTLHINRQFCRNTR